jgi:hypothetical protein
MTVPTEDFDCFVGILWRKGRNENLLIQVLPNSFHVNHRGITLWAGVHGLLEELFEAGLMNEVATWRNMRWASGRVNIFETNCTVSSRSLFHALCKAFKTSQLIRIYYILLYLNRYYTNAIV